MGALPAHGEKLGRAIAVAHRAAQPLLDVRAHGGTQRFTTGPHLSRCDAQGATARLVGQQRRCSGVSGQHRGCEVVEGSHQLGRGHLDGEAARVARQPGVERAQPLHRDIAGEMPAGRAHKGNALGQAQRVQPARQRARCAAAQRLQRVVHGHGLRVLHKNARLATGARAFPHHVAALPGLGDARRVGSEGAQRIQREAGVGHPVIKAIHQLPARHHRQVLQRCAGRGAGGQQLPV